MDFHIWKDTGAAAAAAAAAAARPSVGRNLGRAGKLGAIRLHGGRRHRMYAGI